MNIGYLAVLFYCWRFAFAAKTTNDAPSLVQIITTNSTKLLHSNISAIHGHSPPQNPTPVFPPYPPPSPFHYRVPDSNVLLKFTFYHHMPFLDESKAVLLLRMILVESMEPSRSNVLMRAGMGYRWESGEEAGDVTLEVIPRRLPLLTWGLWATTLTGIVSFVDAYPRVLFAFEMIWSPLEGREHYLGIGELSLY